jgi:hypothetical protein
VEWREFGFTTLFWGEPEFSTLAGNRSATTFDTTGFVAASDSVEFVLWKSACG